MFLFDGAPMPHIAIIIPAYNEEKRIGRMLATYLDYFEKIPLYAKEKVSADFIVVLNGCKDNTARVVREIAAYSTNVRCIELQQAGKGLAVRAGFRAALVLEREADLVGFVDADMATQPQYFYDLVRKIDKYDGIIASRYMPGARVHPARPLIKRWGSRLMYDSWVKLLFGMHYHDVQCGAKLFSRKVIEMSIPFLHVQHWSFDVELLYICKQLGFEIKEHPTIWYDQTDSKLNIIRDGLRMPLSLVKVRLKHRHMPVSNKV